MTRLELLQKACKAKAEKKGKLSELRLAAAEKTYDQIVCCLSAFFVLFRDDLKVIFQFLTQKVSSNFELLLTFKRLLPKAVAFTNKSLE
jgi:hypothetical protein